MQKGDYEKVWEGKLYSNVTWQTSSDIWESRSNYIYYGEIWNNPYLGLQSPITQISAGSEIANGISGFEYSQYNVGGIDYLISFKLDLSKLVGLNGGSIGLFVAASDCANDIAYGQPQVVPIPAAAWLLGTGLIGLVGIRRRLTKN